MMKKRAKITITGIVQGVGFRPFIYKIATELKLLGWVNNSSQGVFIEVEGTINQLNTFLDKIPLEKPAISSIHNIEYWLLDPVGYTNFEIIPSTDGEKTTIILPDLATCSECLQEIFDPENRRYLYPFTNCTNCGPRFSIIDNIPYDRLHTSMKNFVMCKHCQNEYDNPLNRRFHAQPNACPKCGPRLQLWDNQGHILADDHPALLHTVKAIIQGQIIAIKSIGGFHLIVDSRNENSVQRLREVKQRLEKPFALLYPNLNSIKHDCFVSDLEAKLLLSSASPLVLLKRYPHPPTPSPTGEGEKYSPNSSTGEGEKYSSNSSTGEGEKFFAMYSFISPLPLGFGLGVRAVIQNNIAENIAPDNPYLAVMLPSNPLHIILMKELNFPIVATSGNISDEPICIDENEALLRLQNIADLFLIHNRPIVRPIDDSIVRIIYDQEMILRRARGYAPLPVRISTKHKILAVGGHLKNTIAIAISNQVFISQHIGDLTTKLALDSFENIIASFEQLYQFKPEAIACDLHPHYSSSQYAQNYSIPIIKVQHHYAHILSCMAENDLLNKCPLLGIAWDGTGYGLDGTIWGGEFLQINDINFDRIAHFKPFKLPGGDNAIKSPKRIAIALLYEIFGNDVFAMDNLAPIQSCTPQELSILKTMLQNNINTVITTSVGRLFDAISSILNLCHHTTYEGQAAIKLEFTLEKEISVYYPYEIVNNVIDWTKIIKEILTDLKLGLSVGYISTKFHNTLCEIILRIARQTGHKRVIISGGCFQNKYLLETTIKKLIDAKFSPHWPQKIPPNDGGIALGQIIAAERSFCDVCL